MKKEFILGQIVNAKKAIDGLAKTTGLTGKTTMARRRLLKPFNEEIDNFNTLRDDKVKELAVPSETGEISIPPDDPNYIVVVNFVNDLLTSKVEIETLQSPIPVSELEFAKVCELEDVEIDILCDLGIIIDPDRKPKKEKVVAKPELVVAEPVAGESPIPQPVDVEEIVEHPTEVN